MSSQPEDPPRPDFIEFLSDITFNIDGRAVLFAANAARRVADRMNQPDTEGRKYIFERTIAGNLAAFLRAFGTLLADAGYYGPVNVGVAITRLEGGVSVGRHEHLRGPGGLVMWSQVPKFNAQTYTRTRQLSAASELQDARSVALGTLERLFAATTGREDYTPFA